MWSVRLIPAWPAAASIRWFRAVPASSGSPRKSRTLFPDKRRIVLSSDFPGGTERLRTELAAIAAGEFDIVIGTQLVAKGHNFPLMTLVGVLDADIGLTSGDPARGRADLPAPSAGDRSGRARRQAGPGPGPDMAAGPPGDRGARLRGRGAVLPRGDPGPRDGRACHPSAGSPR